MVRWILYGFALTGLLVTCSNLVIYRGRYWGGLSTPHNVTITNGTMTYNTDEKHAPLGLYDYIQIFRDFWDLVLITLVCFLSNYLKVLYAKKDFLEDEIGEDVSVVSATRFCSDSDSFYHEYRGRMSDLYG